MSGLVHRSYQFASFTRVCFVRALHTCDIMYYQVPNELTLSFFSTLFAWKFIPAYCWARLVPPTFFLTPPIG
ncbi:hypothetical protein QJS10_CPA01g02675 [Acorus calamus]|uniref:Uncharacterized protein n=1 Tax=Acorus calamus TaxID=4465 RepID=A0AAV9FGX3_ACOCL|nr:hypothetical protein QJS10_CPA01g02675 [Acorus calamus]